MEETRITSAELAIWQDRSFVRPGKQEERRHLVEERFPFPVHIGPVCSEQSLRRPTEAKERLGRDGLRSSIIHLPDQAWIISSTTFPGHAQPIDTASQIAFSFEWLVIQKYLQATFAAQLILTSVFQPDRTLPGGLADLRIADFNLRN